jgi:hypothetical protein
VAAAVPPWEFEAEYIQSCNCDYGCPCAFNALPTYGNCEALVGFRVTKGHFGPTRLDGLVFAVGYWWPKAIHEGGGVARTYVHPSATPEQVAALDAIAGGKVGGGHWEVFATTLAQRHPTQRVPIAWRFGGAESSFEVQGIGEVHSEHIKNPVSGAKFEGELVLPGGIVFKRALVTSIRRWWMRDEGLLAQHANRAGFVTKVKYNNAGCQPVA